MEIDSRKRFLLEPGSVVDRYDTGAEAEAGINVRLSIGWSVVYAEPVDGHLWVKYRVRPHE